MCWRRGEAGARPCALPLARSRRSACTAHTTTRPSAPARTRNGSHALPARAGASAPGSHESTRLRAQRRARADQSSGVPRHFGVGLAALPCAAAAGACGQPGVRPHLRCAADFAHPPDMRCPRALPGGRRSCTVRSPARAHGVRRNSHDVRSEYERATGNARRRRRAPGARRGGRAPHSTLLWRTSASRRARGGSRGGCCSAPAAAPRAPVRHCIRGGATDRWTPATPARRGNRRRRARLTQPRGERRSVEGQQRVWRCREGLPCAELGREMAGRTALSEAQQQAPRGGAAADVAGGAAPRCPAQGRTRRAWRARIRGLQGRTVGGGEGRVSGLDLRRISASGQGAHHQQAEAALRALARWRRLTPSRRARSGPARL